MKVLCEFLIKTLTKGKNVSEIKWNSREKQSLRSLAFKVIILAHFQIYLTHINIFWLRKSVTKKKPENLSQILWRFVAWPSPTYFSVFTGLSHHLALILSKYLWSKWCTNEEMNESHHVCFNQDKLLYPEKMT